MSTSRDEKSWVASEDVKVREPIIRKVLEQPQIAEIKEVKNVSVIHKTVVQEIHEQPIIEIAKKHETVHVQEQPFVQKVTAPTKFEEVREGFAPEFKLRSAPVHHVEEVGEVKHVNLDEETRMVTNQEIIERHIVPSVTEIREQKVINVIEQPIVRKVIEKPIIREVTMDANLPLIQEQIKFQSQPTTVQTGLSSAPRLSTWKESKLPTQDAEMRDSSIERERQVPSVQESTHHLVGEAPRHGLFSENQFTEELSRGKTLLHNAHPLSNEAFKEEIKYGQEVLHTARPFAAEQFIAELATGKTGLRKSRYFSKDAFLPEFMASKKLLKPTETIYSQELSTLGNWKSDYFGKNIVESATGMFWNAYEKVSHTVTDTYETVKDKWTQDQ